MTQGQRPKAECKVLPGEILHQLPFPGAARLVRVGTGNSPGVSLLPMYLRRGCEYNEGMEQMLPFGHTSAQLPTGLTHSTRLQENHWYPAQPVLACLSERRISDPAVQGVSPTEHISDLACAAPEPPQTEVRPGEDKISNASQGVQPGSVGTLMCVLPEHGWCVYWFVVCLPTIPERRHSCAEGAGNSCRVTECLSQERKSKMTVYV